jgi:hypothetical protein
MSPIRAFLFFILVGVLGSVLSLADAVPQVSTAGYGPDDDYVLVKNCPLRMCAEPADWRPGEQLLHQLFTQQGWSQDPAVVSRIDHYRLTWGKWAADHLYYIDESTPAARRTALNTVLHDLRGRSIHIVRVPAVR